MMRNRDIGRIQQILLMRRLCAYLLVLKYCQLLKDKEQENKAETFTYDAVGNRLAGPKAKDYYSYNNGNQLTNDRKHNYEYDANGNLIKKTEIGDDNKTRTWIYFYDFENRLVKVVMQKDEEIVTVSFKYDPFGRRIGKKVEEIEDGKIEEAKIYNYVYDNEDIILEYLTKTDDDDEGKTGTTRYIHGLGIDEPLAVEQKGNTYYYHADGLGSIVALTDNRGRVVQGYTYDPFGNMKQHGDKVKQPYTFTAREWDEEIGLYYYNARYYDSKAGRFIQLDPIGFDGGDVNLYAYVGNNPVNFVDPRGLAISISWPTTILWPVITIPALTPVGAAIIIGGTIVGAIFSPSVAEAPEKCDKGKWTCQAHCQCTPFGPRSGESQWYVYGIGSGNSQTEAANNAINNCKPKCTRNSYPRHCDTDECWKR